LRCIRTSLVNRAHGPSVELDHEALAIAPPTSEVAQQSRRHHNRRLPQMSHSKIRTKVKFARHRASCRLIEFPAQSAKLSSRRSAERTSDAQQVLDAV
jgi:hypothetical protein